VEVLRDDLSLEGNFEAADVPGTRIQRIRIENLDEFGRGACKDAWRSIASGIAQFRSELIAMQQGEGYGKRSPKRAECLALAQLAVSDVAKTAMSRTSPSAEEITKLATKSTVGVVDPDDLAHGGVCVHPTIRSRSAG
jgi:hypothetical protein